MFNKKAYNKEYSRKRYLLKKQKKGNTFCPYCENRIEQGKFPEHMNQHEKADPKFFAEIDKLLMRRVSWDGLAAGWNPADTDSSAVLSTILNRGVA